MDSLYAEVVVKPRQPIVRNIITTLIYVAIGLFFLYTCWSGIVDGQMVVIAFGLPFEVSVVALNTYFYRRGRIEYEYLYCDDVMIIAKIINKSKRKNMAKIEAENMELVAPVGAKELEQYKQLPIRDFASAGKKGQLYVMVTTLQKKKVRILFEPSDKLLYCFKMKLGTRIVSEKKKTA